MESKNDTTVTALDVSALKAHLALNVESVEQSIIFYRKMFGIEPSKVRTGYAKFDVQNPPLNFTLNKGSFAARGALSHLGIQVRSTADVLATRQKWDEAGLLTRDEMQTNCCYATQDKTWVRDPDGNEWEVFVASMSKVFPDRPIVDIPNSDPIFHTVYDLDERLQVPGWQWYRSGLTYEKGPTGKPEHWRAIYDDKGRIMVAICHNMDLGDAWEWSDDPRYPEKWAGLAYRIAVNYFIYDLTH